MLASTKLSEPTERTLCRPAIEFDGGTSLSEFTIAKSKNFTHVNFIKLQLNFIKLQLSFIKFRVVAPAESTVYRDL